MAHYNLYNSLSLDPSAESSQLVADIDAKLAQLSPENAAARDELTTAREIFSAESRRSQYDEELADPAGSRGRYRTHPPNCSFPYWNSYRHVRSQA
ncbi:hypothetical protein ACKFRS_11210 [Corynebacterium tuberculostearicum]